MEMRFLLALPILLMGHQLAAEESPQRYLESLKSGTMCERRSAVLALYRLGKQAIPALLEHIDDGEIAPSTTLILANPAFSYAPPGSQHDQFTGVLYAYAIELILGRNAISKDEGKRCVYLLGLSDYVYGHGLIFNENELIKANDLSRIKQIYSQWWDKNRNKSLAKMRQDWKASRRPLTGTQYKWH